MPIHFHGHRIDEKRHVVVDDFDNRVRRLPSMFLDARIEHAHADTTGFSLAREVPMGQRRPIEISRLALGEIFGVDLSKITHDKCLERATLLRGNLGADEFEHFFQPLHPAVF